MENYYRLLKGELQMLFRSEFGQDCLNYTIRVGYKKKDYIKKLRERERYEFLNEENKNLQKKIWREESETFMESIERFLWGVRYGYGVNK